MAAPKKTEPAESLVPGSAVLLPDGGEAILLRVEGGEALLRCGTLHGDPVRRPAGQVSPIDAADETFRHEKFRREAVLRGEIEASKEEQA